MAKASAVQNNKKRIKLHNKYKHKRAELKKQIHSSETSLEEKFNLVSKLSKLPRNSAKNRIRNRCEITGRPRGYYRKFHMSRIMLRELAGSAELTGVRKSSW
jgi:small subunit ribosomal protein S14